MKINRYEGINEKLNAIYGDNSVAEVTIGEISSNQDILDLVKYENDIVNEIVKLNEYTYQDWLYPVKLINRKGVIMAAYMQTPRGFKLILIKSKISISKNKKVSEVDIPNVIGFMYKMINKGDEHDNQRV